MGTIFTFYSYKGGVGRTHLLANLAAYLCYYRKRKVLMIDWDLEAPGLHFYYDKTDQTIESKGLLDLFNAHIAKVRSIETDTFSEQDFIAPDGTYISPLVQADNGGVIDLMPAIDYRQEGFHGQVDDFDWVEFYDKFEGGSYLLWFKEQLKQQYDYVLIDSRTGFNDYSGICNVLMPDMNIILVAPNQQNFDGAKQMAMRIVEAKYTQEKKRKPFILPVLSKIDESYGKVSDQWKKRFVNAFAFTIDLLDHDLKMVSKDVLEMIASRTTLSYNADFALGEPIHFEPTAERVSEGSYLKHFENIAVNFLEEMHQQGDISLSKIFAYALLDVFQRNVEMN
ncbi:ParA family protein, partial [Microscilla marina]|uniref:ParA family protein n=1 Tax=Microscilla marina TaxID=1027 RepID=UPI0005D47425